MRKEAHDTFVATAKREPTEAEMRQFLARWLDNEVLYREGLALGLDKGDPAMRERVIFKALNVVQAGVVLPCRTFAEREGSFTNFAGRVQRFAPILEPSFEAWSEAETLQQIAAAAGVEGFAERRTLRDWSKALCAAVPAFAGAGLDHLGPEGAELAR